MSVRACVLIYYLKLEININLYCPALHYYLLLYIVNHRNPLTLKKNNFELKYFYEYSRFFHFSFFKYYPYSIPYLKLLSLISEYF